MGNFSGVTSLTVDSELGLGGIGGAEVVGDDALVFALAGRFHMAQLQCGGVLSNLAPIARLGPEMSLVVNLGVVQNLVVLLPREGHGRVAGAGGRAHEGHVGALDGRLRLGLHRDLRFGEIGCSQRVKKKKVSAKYQQLNRSEIISLVS